MDLFEQNYQDVRRKIAPLAHRMRPKSLDEFVGQEHLLGVGCPLRIAIEEDNIASFIFWGPPGSGKTTLAHLIAEHSVAHVEPLNASTIGLRELRKEITKSEERLRYNGQRTILFLDELHRFNKAQQDFLLTFVENGILLLIGATTENPSFEVNKPLLSRMQVYVFHPLKPEHVLQVVKRALVDEGRGLGQYQPVFSDGAMAALSHIADGDIRFALNAVELCVRLCSTNERGERHVDADMVYNAVQERIVRHDKTGDDHYNVISAFIKSMRDSDPDATVYWLARLLEAGEDPSFIARRMLVLASEDVGNADSQGLLVADAVVRAVEFVGLPEAQLHLAHGAIYLACAKKSNATYSALLAAKKDVCEKPAYPVPLHLRNAPTQLMKELGYGKGYEYAHDFPNRLVKQTHLPDSLRDKTYYKPSDIGAEQQINEHLETIRRVRDDE